MSTVVRVVRSFSECSFRHRVVSAVVRHHTAAAASATATTPGHHSDVDRARNAWIAAVAANASDRTNRTRRVGGHRLDVRRGMGTGLLAAGYVRYRTSRVGSYAFSTVVENTSCGVLGVTAGEGEKRHFRSWEFHLGRSVSQCDESVTSRCGKQLTARVPAVKPGTPTAEGAASSPVLNSGNGCALRRGVRDGEAVVRTHITDAYAGLAVTNRVWSRYFTTVRRASGRMAGHCTRGLRGRASC